MFNSFVDSIRKALYGLTWLVGCIAGAIVGLVEGTYSILIAKFFPKHLERLKNPYAKVIRDLASGEITQGEILHRLYIYIDESVNS